MMVKCWNCGTEMEKSGDEKLLAYKSLLRNTIVELKENFDYHSWCYVMSLIDDLHDDLYKE